tara:strand:+ start:134 stop:352 length:219 start_codon:yes stop_codon:yes gene_type:complete
MNRDFDITKVTKYGTEYLKEYIRVTDAEQRREHSYAGEISAKRPFAVERHKWQRQAELIEAELKWRKTQRNR